MYLQFAGHIVILAARVGDEFAGDGRDLIVGQVDLAEHGQPIEVALQLADIVVGHLQDLQIGQQSLRKSTKRCLKLNSKGTQNSGPTVSSCFSSTS